MIGEKCTIRHLIISVCHEMLYGNQKKADVLSGKVTRVVWTGSTYSNERPWTGESIWKTADYWRVMLKWIVKVFD